MFINSQNGRPFRTFLCILFGRIWDILISISWEGTVDQVFLMTIDEGREGKKSLFDWLSCNCGCLYEINAFISAPLVDLVNLYTAL